jgi:hypothetical protein
MEANCASKLSLNRCYDFENIFAEKIAKILAFFAKTTASFCINLIITLVFEEKRHFFAEIGTNCRRL